ncbi:MAG TPA: DNA polymerase/3'-5' exonuclease PolX [Candidatus Paceibacterota bacterium]
MNKELAAIFSRIALYLRIDDVPFKPQAYERAAEVLETLSENVEAIYAAKGTKGLDEIPGIGKGMIAKIEEYVKTGKIQEYELLRKKIPVDIEELVRVEGLGPKMVRDLYKHLNIKTLGDLEKAAKAGRIRNLPRFGEKTEQNILQGIEFVKRSQERWLLGDIYPFEEDLQERLQQSSAIQQAVVAGSIRRMKETIGDVDILVTSSKPEQAIRHFLSLVPQEKIWGKGSTKVSVRTTRGFDIDMRIVPENVFGAALQYFTGSKEHNVKLRTYAASKGYKLNEYGLYKGKKLVACRTEQDVYKALGMAYIEPELREDQGEIDKALAGTLPKVIPYGSLRGDLQVQTDWTDGKHSIEAMTKEAQRQGLEYIAITDHTRDLAMTGGLDEKKLLRQAAEIDKLNKKLSGITILKGAEVNIRKDGSLDIADEALARLDVVGIAVHTNMKMSKKDMTERITRAMENPHADILFHPTGRILLERDEYEVDIEKVIQTARKTGTVLEINASKRHDLKDAYIKKAKEAGCKFAIDSDAHATEHIAYLRYGVGQARRGWAEKKDVVNVWPLEKMVSFLK